MKRISIAVHGRFHAFDLAAALLRSGSDVRLFTNYPRRVVAQWFPADRTHSLITHGLLTRAAHTLAGGEPPVAIESRLKRQFARWAAGRVRRWRPDIAHSWSGVAEETMQQRTAARCTMTRGSAHIEAQNQLLIEEEARTGVRLERPSVWALDREQREYALADRIVVPSAFARETFVARGVGADKVRVVGLALRAPRFIAAKDTISERVQRLRAGAPLRILYAGTISYQKGMHDMLGVLRALGSRMKFRLVGPLARECHAFAREAARYCTVDGALPERQLAAAYAWGDVFLLPTLQDGFAVVLAQAQAAGLPILTTSNSGGPDIIAGGGQGWVVPIRAPEEIIARLEWCDAHRGEIAAMVEALHEAPPQRGWDDVARDFLMAVST